MKNMKLTKEDINKLMMECNCREKEIDLTQKYLINHNLEITKLNICMCYNRAKEIWSKNPNYLQKFSMSEMFRPIEDYKSVSQIRYKKYPFLKVAGVYAIYDKDEIVYVGQSTNIYERWKTHNRNTVNFKKVYKNEYVKYQYFKEHYEDIYCGILELIDDNEKLKWIEGFYINKFMPKLNNEIISLKHTRRRLKDNYFNKINTNSYLYF